MTLYLKLIAVGLLFWLVVSLKKIGNMIDQTGYWTGYKMWKGDS